MKHAGGRPTKYKDEYVEMVDKYLATTGLEQMNLATKEDFALLIGVDEDTLNNWANAHDYKQELIHPEFFGALRKLMLTQRRQLINIGIFGGKEINATIIKLMLQNNHGMKERQDVTTDGDKIQVIFHESQKQDE